MIKFQRTVIGLILPWCHIISADRKNIKIYFLLKKTFLGQDRCFWQK